MDLVNNMQDEKEAIISIRMLSPERLLEISCGEVMTPDTINYKSLRAEPKGLFCERIFGPEKDWECHCGKYKKVRYRGVVCDRCGVEVTKANVRRERYGHIELGCNVVYPQYLYGTPSILATVLDLPQNFLESIIFLNQKVDVENYWNYTNKLQAINRNDIWWQYDNAGTNALATILDNIDLDEELRKIEEKLESISGYLAQPYLHRKEVLSAFKETKNEPRWMITSKILVLPAGLRPIAMYKGEIVSAEINERYLTILRRAKLIKRFNEMNTPSTILNMQKHMIQFAVETLFDADINKEKYRSTTSLLYKRKKKIDRFSDYSASGTVFADSRVDIESIGMPVDVICELFKPYIMRDLIETGTARNIKHANRLIAQRDVLVRDAIEDISENLFVLAVLENSKILKLRIQVSYNNIFSLSPFIYRFFGFESRDKKELKVFALLSDESKAEAEKYFSVKKQIVDETAGKVQIVPDKYAINWLIEMSKMVQDKGKTCSSINEAFCAYSNKCVSMTEKIMFYCHTLNGFDYRETTTLGRIIINEFLPQNMGVVNRKNFKNKYLLEHNYEFTEQKVYSVLREIYYLLGADEYINVIKNYDKTMQRYLNAVEVEFENCSEFISDVNNIEKYAKQFYVLKQITRRVAMNDVMSASKHIRLEYDTDDILFWKKYLLGRVLASDIYDFTDVIAPEGTVITEQIVEKIYSKQIQTVTIYDDFVKKGKIYSKVAFGADIKGEPFKVSLLAVMKNVNKMSSIAAEGYMELLLKNEFLEVNRLPSELLESCKKSRYFGKILEVAWCEEDNIIAFWKLPLEQCIELKEFLLFLLLRKERIVISVRFVDILLKAIYAVDDSDYSMDKVIVSNIENTLEDFGESAVKGFEISSMSPIVKTTYGNIYQRTDIYYKSQKLMLKDDEIDDYSEYEDGEDFFEEDDEWDVYDDSDEF